MKRYALLLLCIFLFSGCESHSSYDSQANREEIISESWDDVARNMTGSEFIEACSSSSGNCYTLDADITEGSITLISFPNGGYLYFDAEIDSMGEASDIDKDGNSWDFTIDMNSSLVTDAIEQVIEERTE